MNYITLQEIEGMPAFVDKPKVPQWRRFMSKNIVDS